MREQRTLGSVRGAASNGRPYRDSLGCALPALCGRQPAVAAFMAGLDPGLIRIRRTAVYMTGNPEGEVMCLLGDSGSWRWGRSSRSEIPFDAGKKAAARGRTNFN